MISTAQLLEQQGTVWSERPPSDLSKSDNFLWRTIAELASMVELFIEPDEAIEIAPLAVTLMRNVEAYFADRTVLRPYALPHMLLLIDRAQAGFEPRGL